MLRNREKSVRVLISSATLKNPDSRINFLLEVFSLDLGACSATRNMKFFDLVVNTVDGKY